jgi:hypothetical protein
MCDRPLAGVRPPAPRNPGMLLMGQPPEESTPREPAPVQWQHGQVPCSAWIPLSPAFGKRQWMFGNTASGFAPATANRAEAAVPPKALWMLKRHSAFVRVIAAGPAAQRHCSTRHRYEVKNGP